MAALARAMDVVAAGAVGAGALARVRGALEAAAARAHLPGELRCWASGAAWAAGAGDGVAAPGSGGAGEEAGPGRLDVAALCAALQAAGARRYGAVLLYAPCLASTQDVVHNTTGLPEGTVCVADVQTRGRGRGDNVWTSPPGCLLFTMASTVSQGATLPLVQYLACLAVVEGVQSLPGFAACPLRIKWPNDIYVAPPAQAAAAVDSSGGDADNADNADNADGAGPKAGARPAATAMPDQASKVGGILCQSTIKGREFSVSIGIGLNVDNAHPTTCLNALCPPARVTREAVLAAILARFEALHGEFERDGFAPRLQGLYERHWLHSGQRVRLEAEGGREAEVLGLSVAAGGALLARCAATGEALELLPDGNRFDFFSGLVSRRAAAP